MFKVLRCLSILAFALAPAGCSRPKIEGSYRDAENPAITYVLSGDGSWRAEVLLEVGAGVFPHGSGRRLEGSFEQRGDTIALRCTGVLRQEPMTGEFRSEALDTSDYDHTLRVEEGALLPVAAEEGKEAVFASDINPLGARKLVPAGD